MCPARGDTICTVCCATKRLVEINCPGDCPHLAASREHPAAVVKRQQERDVSALLPTIKDFTERQYQLFFVLHTVIARHQPEGLARLVDADVAEAAGAAAATLETAARGVIYDHAPQSRPAQRLAIELKGAIAELRERGAPVYDREAALVLRGIERGARDAGPAAGSETAYLELMGRLLQVNRAAAAAEPQAGAGRTSSIILP
jgi:hypothetical protein